MVNIDFYDIIVRKKCGGNMFLCRALNDYDIISEPLKNGIASKQMIYDLVKRYYENDRKNKEYHTLSTEEKEYFIKAHIEEYLKSHNHKLAKLFEKSSNQSREHVREYREFLKSIKGTTLEEKMEMLSGNPGKINFGSYIYIINYLSTLQQHLIFGSTKMTDWISTSTNMGNIMKFYDAQKIHKMAIIKSDTGGLVDSANIMSVDLSTYEEIKKNSPYLCNGIDIKDNEVIKCLASLSLYSPEIALNFKEKLTNETNINCRGFKYSTNAKEVCILKYIPKEHIISVLEAIQIDLIGLDRFNKQFICMPQNEQENELERFKTLLFRQLKQDDDPYLLYLFDELYVQNKNVNEIVSFNQSKKYIEHNKNKILSLSSKIPSPMLKRTY